MYSSEGLLGEEEDRTEVCSFDELRIIVIMLLLKLLWVLTSNKSRRDWC